MKKLSQYNKAIQAVLGLLLVVGTALLGMKDVLPEDVSTILTMLFAVGTAVQVWWVKNEPLISDLAKEAQVLVEDVKEIVKPTTVSLEQYVEPQLTAVRNDLGVVAQGLAETNRMMHQLVVQANAPVAGKHSAEEVQSDGLVPGSAVPVEGADDSQTGGLA